MFLLVFCLVGSVVALPAVPWAPTLPAARPLFIHRSYPAPLELAPFKPLEIKIEPAPKDENAESPEPNQELSEFPEEPKANAPDEPKEPAPEPDEIEIKKLSFDEWIQSFGNIAGEWLELAKPPPIIPLMWSTTFSSSPRMYPAVMVIDEAKP